MKLDEYDFLSAPDYNSSVISEKIDYTTIMNDFSDMNSYSYIRAALFKKNLQEWCKTYKGVPNCLVHDDSSFDQTFRCLECEEAFYLTNEICQTRTIDVNCIEYYKEKNECKIFLDTLKFAISYNSNDIFVIENQPPKYIEKEISDVGLEGCIQYFSKKMCKTCGLNLYLYDNLCLDITIFVSDCEIYKSNGICQKCLDDYLLFQNKCLYKYAKNCDGFLTNTKCNRCPSENPIQKLDGNCYKNKNVPFCEFYDSINSCLFCDLNYENKKGKCSLGAINFISNCERQVEGEICAKCEIGYYLSSTSKECLKNPTYDRNCQNFDTNNSCVLCDYGYYFMNGYCYPCKTDTDSCLLCNPNDSNKCLLCRQGYFMNNTKECILMIGYTVSKVRIRNEDETNHAYLDS